MAIIIEPKYDLVISIVVFNQKLQELSPLLQDLMNVQKIKTHVVIIDNSPLPQNTSSISAEALDFEYIFSGQNLGYGKAHNIAIQKYLTQSRYHLVLNPDIRIIPGTIEALLKEMNQKPNIGLSIPPTTYEDGSIQSLVRLLPTPMDLLVRLLPFPQSLKKKINDRYELKTADYQKSLVAPYLSGCFMLLRTSILKELIQEISTSSGFSQLDTPLKGPFDDRFFMYFEDVDLSRRVFKRSACQYIPVGKIVHGYQKGSRKSVPLLLAHIKSAIQYFSKWGWVFDLERTQINKKISLNKGQTPHEPSA